MFKSLKYRIVGCAAFCGCLGIPHVEGTQYSKFNKAIFGEIKTETAVVVTKHTATNIDVYSTDGTNTPPTLSLHNLLLLSMPSRKQYPIYVVTDTLSDGQTNVVSHIDDKHFEIGMNNKEIISLIKTETGKVTVIELGALYKKIVSFASNTNIPSNLMIERELAALFCDIMQESKMNFDGHLQEQRDRFAFLDIFINVFGVKCQRWDEKQNDKHFIFLNLNSKIVPDFNLLVVFHVDDKFTANRKKATKFVLKTCYPLLQADLSKKKQGQTINYEYQSTHLASLNLIYDFFQRTLKTKKQILIKVPDFFFKKLEDNSNMFKQGLKLTIDTHKDVSAYHGAFYFMLTKTVTPDYSMRVALGELFKITTFDKNELDCIAKIFCGYQLLWPYPYICGKYCNDFELTRQSVEAGKETTTSTFPFADDVIKQLINNINDTDVKEKAMRHVPYLDSNQKLIMPTYKRCCRVVNTDDQTLIDKKKSSFCYMLTISQIISRHATKPLFGSLLSLYSRTQYKDNNANRINEDTLELSPEFAHTFIWIYYMQDMLQQNAPLKNKLIEKLQTMTRNNSIIEQNLYKLANDFFAEREYATQAIEKSRVKIWKELNIKK